jgi:hypothetical protein
MKSFIRKLPVRDSYKDLPDSVVHLKAPPTVSKSCFLFEILIAAIAFATSFYISFNSTVSITTITYEPLGNPYVCQVLSPRSDSVEISKEDNEFVHFSSSRYLLHDCIKTLESGGLDVCANEHRREVLTGVSALVADDDNCLDILLNGDYRLCYSAELVHQFSTISMPSFPVGSESTVLPPVFYFMKDSNSVVIYDAPFGASDVISDFVPSENRTSIFVVAPSRHDNNYYLFEFDSLEGTTAAAAAATAFAGGGVGDSRGNRPAPTEQVLQPKQLLAVDLEDMAFVGLTVEHRLVHIGRLDGNTYLLDVTTYDTNARTASDIHSFDCHGLVEFDELVPPNRFLSANSATGKLYAMCGAPAADEPLPYFTFFELDTTTLQERQLHTNISSLAAIHAESWAESHKLTTVHSLAAPSTSDGGSFVYLSTEKDHDNNLIQVNVSAAAAGSSSFSSAAMQSLINLGIHKGDHLARGYGSTMYCANGIREYYNVSTAAFEVLPSLPSYFYTRHVGVGYSYQICNGKHTDYDIDPFDLHAFHYQCRDING